MMPSKLSGRNLSILLLTSAIASAGCHYQFQRKVMGIGSPFPGPTARAVFQGNTSEVEPPVQNLTPENFL